MQMNWKKNEKIFLEENLFDNFEMEQRGSASK